MLACYPNCNKDLLVILDLPVREIWSGSFEVVVGSVTCGGSFIPEKRRGQHIGNPPFRCRTQPNSSNWLQHLMHTARDGRLHGMCCIQTKHKPNTNTCISPGVRLNNGFCGWTLCLPVEWLVLSIFRWGWSWRTCSSRDVTKFWEFTCDLSAMRATINILNEP